MNALSNLRRLFEKFCTSIGVTDQAQHYTTYWLMFQGGSEANGELLQPKDPAPTPPPEGKPFAWVATTVDGTITVTSISQYRPHGDNWVAVYTAPQNSIQMTCAQGHSYVKLLDQKTICPICLTIALERSRAEVRQLLRAQTSPQRNL